MLHATKCCSLKMSRTWHLWVYPEQHQAKYCLKYHLLTHLFVEGKHKTPSQTTLQIYNYHLNFRTCFLVFWHCSSQTCFPNSTEYTQPVLTNGIFYLIAIYRKLSLKTVAALLHLKSSQISLELFCLGFILLFITFISGYTQSFSC